MASSWHRGSTFRLLSFEPYHFARIHTKVGKEIIITSLMSPKIEDVTNNIRDVPVEKKV
jgi:hypothetical protein